MASHRFYRAAGLLAVLAPVAAQADFPWLEATPMTPEAGAQVQAKVAFGDGADGAEPLDAERITELRLHDAGGEMQEIEAAGRFDFDAPEQSGTAALSGRQARSFYTRTPEGGKRQSKEDLPDATHCTYSDNAFKLFLNVDGTQVASRAIAPLGHPLELIPVTDPAELRAGDVFRVLVGFDDAPLPEGAVSARRLEDDAAHTLGDRASTDGIVDVRLPKAGTWLLHAEHRTDFDDDDVCDENVYNATMMFTVSE